MGKIHKSPKNVRFLSVKTQFYMNGFILRKEWRMWAKVVGHEPLPPVYPRWGAAQKERAGEMLMAHPNRGCVV